MFPLALASPEQSAGKVAFPSLGRLTRASFSPHLWFRFPCGENSFRRVLIAVVSDLE